VTTKGDRAPAPSRRTQSPDFRSISGGLQAVVIGIRPEIAEGTMCEFAELGIKPAENITPLVGRDAIARYGPGLLAVVNKVSVLLDTGTLRALDARVELARQDARLVAPAGCAHTDSCRTGVSCLEQRRRARGHSGPPGHTAAGFRRS
jgi:hypothetical protein